MKSLDSMTYRVMKKIAQVDSSGTERRIKSPDEHELEILIKILNNLGRKFSIVRIGHFIDSLVILPEEKPVTTKYLSDVFTASEILATRRARAEKEQQEVRKHQIKTIEEEVKKIYDSSFANNAGLRFVILPELKAELEEMGFRVVVTKPIRDESEGVTRIHLT